MALIRPLSVAVQGVGFAVPHLALQGLVADRPIAFVFGDADHTVTDPDDGGDERSLAVLPEGRSETTE